MLAPMSYTLSVYVLSLIHILLDAFKYYADGAIMREITDEMNIWGVRTKRGGKININCVTRMLHNRKYIGEYKYRDVLIEGGIPAIIPKDLFDRVQERMAQTKKAPAKHKAEDEYLLTTKLFCGKCKCLKMCIRDRFKTILLPGSLPMKTF